MRVKIKGFLTFKDSVKAQILDLAEKERNSLRDLLIRVSLENKIGNSLYRADLGTINQNVLVLVNGRNLTNLVDGLDTLLQDGDEIAIFPPLAGG